MCFIYKNFEMIKYSKTMRFIITGLLATAVHFFTFYFLDVVIKSDPKIANSLASIAGILFSYMSNSLFTFSAKITLKNFRRFFLVYSLSPIVAFIAIHLAQLMALNYYIGLILGIVVQAILNFLLLRRFVYV